MRLLKRLLNEFRGYVPVLFQACLKGVERHPGVPVGGQRQELQGFFRYLGFRLLVFAIDYFQRPFDDRLQIFFLEPFQNENARPGKKGAVDFEARVFGGGADEGECSVFNIGEKGVLLRFVPTVDLVYEQDGFLSGRLALLGLRDYFH